MIERDGISRLVAGRRKPSGFSLVEIMVAMAIVVLLAGVSAQRFLSSMNSAKRNSCHVNKSEVEIQVQRWRRAKARWPRPDLLDVASDPGYFSDGAPTCAVTGEAYRLDASHHVIGHDH